MNGSLLYRTILWIIRAFFHGFYHFHVHGLEHYPSRGALIAANHTSFLDPPAIAIACPEAIHFLARHSLFTPLFGHLIKKLNAHPLYRGKRNVQAIKEIEQLLKRGEKVLLFPEGSRSPDGRLGAIKPGIATLFAKSRSTIIPTHIQGAFAAWNRNRKFPKLRGEIAVIFGSPIRWEEYRGVEEGEVRAMVAKRLVKSLLALRNWWEEGARGSPP